MRKVFPLIICLLISFCIFTSCNGSSGTQSVVTMSIGPEGGNISSADGLLTLEVPAGALPAATSISLESFDAGSSNLLFYELLPAGLQFQIPATMRVNVSSIMLDSSAEDLRANALPVIVSTNEAGDGIEALDELELNINSDTNSFGLSGKLNHFSKFAIGGNLNAAVGIEGVPQFWPANTPFGPVQVQIVVGERTDETFFSGSYIDSSLNPVIYGEVNPFVLFPLPAANQSQVYSLRYACGDPGVGLYLVELNFLGQTNAYRLVTTPEEIDIANAFLFGITGPPVSDSESRVELTFMLESYKLIGNRQVNCGGTAPVEDPSSAPESGGTDTAGGDTAGGDTSGSQEPPTISTTTAQVSIDHTVGQTECPTNGQPIIVTSDSGSDLTIQATENLPFFNINPATANTPGGSATFTPSFPCSGFNTGENRGSLFVSGNDPQTGLSSNTIEIPVVVTVR